MALPLAGRAFVILDFPAKIKLLLSRQIEALGGSLSYVVNRSLFAVITSAEEYERKSSKILQAEKHNVLILDSAYLDAVNKDHLLVSKMASRNQQLKDHAGRYYEWNFSLNRPTELPALKNPVAHLGRSLADAARQLAAIAAVVFAELDTPSVSELEDGASSDDASSDSQLSSSWANQVANATEKAEKGALAVDGLDPSLPLWKRRMLVRQAETKERQEKEKAAKLEGEAARARAKHEERQALQKENREEARMKKEKEIERKAEFAAQRKSTKKRDVFAKRDKMVEERRAVREGEEDAKKAAAEEKRQKVIDEKLAALTEIAKKIVERELHKDEFEAKQKAYLAEKEKKRMVRHGDNQRKLFVGNVIVEDIVHASKKLTGEMDEEKYNILIKGRTEALLEVFKRFGKVDNVLPFWEKKHAFIMFASEVEARKAYDTLKNYEKRKEYAEETRKKLAKDKQPQLMAHKPNYYVRWNYNKTVKTKWGKGKKGEVKKEGDEEEQKDDSDNDKTVEANPKSKSADSDSPCTPGGDEIEPIERSNTSNSNTDKKAAAKAKAKAKAKSKSKSKSGAKGGKKAEKPKAPTLSDAAPPSAFSNTSNNTSILPVVTTNTDDWTCDSTNDVNAVQSFLGGMTVLNTSSGYKPIAFDAPNTTTMSAVCHHFLVIGGPGAGNLRLVKGHNDIETIHTFKTSPDGMTCLAMATCDENTPVVVAGYEDGNVRIWKGKSDESELPTLLGTGSPVLSVGVGGHAVAVALVDLSLQLWTTDGELKCSNDAPHGKIPFRVLLSNNNSLPSYPILTYAEDGTYKRFNFSLRSPDHAGIPVNPKDDHSPHAIRTAVISPDGSIAAFGAKNEVYLHDTQMGKILYSISTDGAVRSLNFSPLRYWLVVGSLKHATIIDLETKTTIFSVPVAKLHYATFPLETATLPVLYVGLANHLHAYKIEGF